MLTMTMMNDDGFKEYRKVATAKAKRMTEPFTVDTMEGVMSGKAGDYLMVGVDGEQYVCDANIFHKTYVPVEQVMTIKNDPILLAESPFGDFYYILCAWDKEISIVDELLEEQYLVDDKGKPINKDRKTEQ